MTDRRHHPGQDVPDPLHYQTDRAESRESTAHPSRTSTSVTPTETASRSRIPDRVRQDRRRLHYQPRPTVDVRLADALGGSPATWHQKMYGERGTRWEAIEIVRALRRVGRNPLEWLAPILAEANGVDGDEARKVAADAAENVTTFAVKLNPDCPKTLKQAALNLEREAAEGLALAAAHRERLETLR